VAGDVVEEQEEAAKKAGLINSYRVYVVEARTPHDPDLYLVVEYRNWAALDGIGSKLDGISASRKGSSIRPSSRRSSAPRSARSSAHKPCRRLT
jgi:hypothetical protein